MAHIALSLVLAALVSGCATGAGDAGGLAGQWSLNQERTVEVQPRAVKQRDPLGGLSRPAVSVGGIPLPTPGSTELPSTSGSARDPRVLHTASLAIEPGEDELTLVYAGGQRETLERGDDQGLISHWSADELTSRYETTSREVRQTYQVQRDGSLLVTVRLDPNQGPAVVHKRVFDRADTP